MKKYLLLVLLIPNLVIAEVYECRPTFSSGYLSPFKQTISYSRVRPTRRGVNLISRLELGLGAAQRDRSYMTLS